MVLQELLGEYDGKIRVVLKHMVVHPQQVAKAHLAACAAGKQNKFVEFYKAYWEKGYQARNFAEENVYAIAGEVGLNVEQLKTDMQACQQFVAADQAELQKFRVSGTPAFFINGEFIGGGLDKSGYKKIIDKKLEDAQKSGVPGAEYYNKEILAKGEREVAKPRRGQ